MEMLNMDAGFYGGRTVGNNDSENFVETVNITMHHFHLLLLFMRRNINVR